MKPAKVNLLIDWASFIALLGLVTTGWILYVTLPPGSRGREFLGLTRHEWGDVHFAVALTFLGLIGYHLFLHWNWIKAMHHSRG